MIILMRNQESIGENKLSVIKVDEKHLAKGL